MFMWGAIITYLIAFFSAMICLVFNNDAVAGKSREAVVIHRVSGVCVFVCIFIAAVFLVAAVKYD